MHPAVQRKGLGARLVDHITGHARTLGYDYIGSSFGATPELLDFWHHRDWLPVRLSIQKGSSSGSRSAVVLKGLSAEGEALVRKARDRFFAHFPHQLADCLQDLDVELVRRLMRRDAVPSWAPDEGDRNDIQAFAREQRLFEVSIGAIWRLTCHAFMAGRHIDQLDTRERTLLVTRVLQKRPWRDCVDQADVAGRSEALALLKRAVAKLAG